MEKWKRDYLTKMKLMTNEEVFDEYSSYCGGDDYDGCMTQRGTWIFGKITEELIIRLKACKFLK